MKEAMLYRQEKNAGVICQLCSHRCAISDGSAGICGVRVNENGTLYTLVYDKIVAQHVDPIEKKPLYHVLPGSLSYSIATVGCNFRCLNCQNYEISQIPGRHSRAIPGVPITPEEIVNAALRNRCQSIAYTYTEPTIYFELAYETARLAKRKGLKNLFVTNGYMTAEALETIQPYLDAANVDLKGFNEPKYRKVCGGTLELVKETIRRMNDLGVWVEVTTLVIPTHNDSETELRAIAEFIASVNPAIPWHVSAFHPQYKMAHIPQTSPGIIYRAVDIGKEVGLWHVYSGNLRSDETSTTLCHHCGTPLIRRSGFFVVENAVAQGQCPNCDAPVGGIFL
ncbi:pyruvate-formate lyase-activating enzyme [Candidatus Moduliflexus flocculans]|uniref:Pyruvate-formate lyase-activating enzyme n=1 Tax=Candidatus Moduliflexus flocculans TaxID=1499966 RepID=A0A081BN41_9BACT|nr:pyruvate-formate lyase-activating enzyme [Candidatus Moduliflexus flocculans]